MLYFENQSGRRDLAWLRQGLADMVITDLSRFDGVAVLSAQQLERLLSRSGVAPDDPINLDQAMRVGRAAGAEAIVLGSFAAIGDTVRLAAKVHDTRTGHLIAAETAITDRPDQVLTEVDLLALRVANRLGASSESDRGGGSLTDLMTNNLDAYRYYTLGLQKSNALKTAESIALFQKAVHRDPGFAMAYARIGYTYALTHAMPDRAKPYLQKAFELSGRLTARDRLYVAAWYAIANRDYGEAIARLKEITARYPFEVEAYWRLGMLLIAEPRAEEARAVLERGRAIDPDNKDIANALGGVYQLLGRRQDAIAAHQRYVALAPRESNAYDSLGVSYQAAGMYAEAIDAYGRARALDPGFEVAIVHLGNTYYQLGRYLEAIEQYQRYIEVADYDQDRSRGYGSIAWVELKRGNLDAASSAARRGMKLRGSPLTESVFIALARGDRTTARRLAAELPAGAGRGGRLSPRFDEHLKGELALADGRADEALEHFRVVLQSPPVTYAPETYADCLADALRRLGRYGDAIVEYERVLRVNPNLARARYGLAEALDRKGDGDRAVAQYQRFLQIWSDADPDVPELVHAKQRLAALTSH